MSVICNVCRLEITDATEAAKDRVYLLRNGRTLPPQKKHDVCDASYGREKTGLQKVSDAPIDRAAAKAVDRVARAARVR